LINVIYVIYDSNTTSLYVIYWWCHSFNRFYEIDCEFVDNLWDWVSISDSIFDSGEASKIRLSILNKQLLKLLMFDCRIRIPNYTRVVLLWLCHPINCFHRYSCEFEQFVRLSFDIRIWWSIKDLVVHAKQTILEIIYF